MRPALVAFALLVVPAVAAERLPTFPKRTDYGSARASLMALGWEPAPSPTQSCAPGFEERCAAYPEAETCRGTGIAACDMLWRKSGRLIEVQTFGEDDPPKVSAVRCRAGC
jgi:hypothetical protein